MEHCGVRKPTPSSRPKRRRPKASVRSRPRQLSEQTRHRVMSAIRSKNTAPELAVRRMVYALGCRFRIHRHGVPGRPDVALIGQRKAIYVHGCFWHQHEGCSLARIPKRNLEYWLPKFARNRARDERDARQLGALGWKRLVVWECQTRSNPELLERKLAKFLSLGKTVRS